MKENVFYEIFRKTEVSIINSDFYARFISNLKGSIDDDIFEFIIFYFE